MPPALERELALGWHQQARAAAAHFRLPFHRQAWRGAVGNWMGTGLGSSVDFQDHRPYLPGDDVRYIDWPAYARTGHYIMKLYREEVSPRVDLLVDLSPSMRLDPAKAARTGELFYFCVESAARAGASLQACAVIGDCVQRLAPEAIAGHAFPDFQTLEHSAAVFPAIGRIPLRPGSLRIVISDLLFPGEPDRLLRPLVASRGRGVLLVPFSAGEAEPDWDGNYEFIDCESAARRHQRIDAPLRERYRAAYGRHFTVWREAARRIGITLARLPAEPALAQVLRDHALPAGAAEVWT